MLSKIEKYKEGEISKEEILEIFQGWNAYAKWADCFKLRKEVVKKITFKRLENVFKHFFL